jgi:hypothetical protein
LSSRLSRDILATPDRGVVSVFTFVVAVADVRMNFLRPSHPETKTKARNNPTKERTWFLRGAAVRFSFGGAGRSLLTILLSMT